MFVNTYISDCSNQCFKELSLVQFSAKNRQKKKSEAEKDLLLSVGWELLDSDYLK